MSIDHEEELVLEASDLELEDISDKGAHTQVSDAPELRSDTAAIPEPHMRPPLDRNATIANEEPPPSFEVATSAVPSSAPTYEEIPSVRPLTTSSGRPTDAAREMVDLKRERNAKEREVLELRQQLHQKELDLLSWQDREAEFEAKYVELETSHEDTRNEYLKTVSALQIAQNRLATIEDKNSGEIQDLKRQLGERTMKEAELEGTVQKVNTELRAKKAELNTVNLRVETVEDEISEANERIFEFTEKVRSQDDELAQLIASLATAKQRATEFQNKSKSLSTQCEELSNSNAELQSQLSSATGQARAFQDQLSDTRQNLVNAEKSVRALEKNREKAHQALEVFMGILKESDYGNDSEE